MKAFQGHWTFGSTILLLGTRSELSDSHSGRFTFTGRQLPVPIGWALESVIFYPLVQPGTATRDLVRLLRHSVRATPLSSALCITMKRERGRKSRRVGESEKSWEK